jgi:hypothetical protein
MIEVSYKRFQRISRFFCWCFKWTFKLPFLKHIIPRKWWDIYRCPYYYLVDDENCPDVVRPKLVYKHKAVKCYDTEGLLLGIAVTMDDYYYIVLDNTGKKQWCTCVGPIEGM